jgi:serine/threonine protein kinase
MKYRKKYSIKGGKIIGRGSYGIVNYPPLIVVRETIRKEGCITKLLKNQAAINEQNENKTVMIIDPEMEYTIYPEPTIYKAAPFYINRTDSLNNYNNTLSDIPLNVLRNLTKVSNNIQTANEKEMNAINQKLSSDYSVLRAPKAEGSLEKLIQGGKYEIDDILNGFNNLWKALTIFDEKNFAHYDIKPDNIVFNYDSNNKPYNFKFIDFGLSIDLTQKHIKMISEQPYAYWPIHNFILALQYYPENASDKPYLDRIKDKCNVGLIEINYLEQLKYNKKTAPIFTMHYVTRDNNEVIFTDEMCKQLTPELLTPELLTPELLTPELLKTIYKKTDVYSLAMTMAEMLNPFYTNMLIEKDVDFILLLNDAGLPDDKITVRYNIKSLNNSLKKEIDTLEQIANFLIKCLRFNTNDRLNASEAFEEYNKLLEVLKQSKSSNKTSISGNTQYNSAPTPVKNSNVDPGWMIVESSKRKRVISNKRKRVISIRNSQQNLTRKKYKFSAPYKIRFKPTRKRYNPFLKILHSKKSKKPTAAKIHYLAK